MTEHSLYCTVFIASDAQLIGKSIHVLVFVVLQHALLQTVVEACVKKRQCKFSTSLKSPEAVVCPNQTKFVEVAYKCRPLEFRSKIICENDTINLKCKRNARIAIYSATFGRIHFQSLQCPQPAGVDEESK